MSISPTLLQRANSACELCTSTNALNAYEVGPSEGTPADADVLLCEPCQAQVEGGALNSEHLQCLSTSMWSTEPAVQVLAWRLLKRLSGESWANELLDMMYLEDDMAAWAEAGLVSDDAVRFAPTRDSNGAELKDGDTVTLIKDLVVKGAGFTAKRGTSVRNISLTDNPEHIEGRVNGTRIVLVSAFLKKTV